MKLAMFFLTFSRDDNVYSRMTFTCKYGNQDKLPVVKLRYDLGGHSMLHSATFPQSHTCKSPLQYVFSIKY